MPTPSIRTRGAAGPVDDVQQIHLAARHLLTLVQEVLATSHDRAVSRGLALSVFTADLFATGNDRDNRAAVRAVPRKDLDLVGLAVYGPRNVVDKVTKGARMHP